MAVPVAIGVDNGGTWIRIKALDTKGRCVWSLKKPSPSVDGLPAFLQKHLQRFGGNLSVLSVGSRGVWKPAKRKALRYSLRGLARNIVVMSDVEAAWFSAFTEKEKGIVVIAGTGSIAYGRRSDGTFARSGGLGPSIGDEGSGYWIGKTWHESQGQSFTTISPNSVRRIAQKTPFVIQKARQGDKRAQRIIRQAQQHLVDLLPPVIQSLSLKGKIHVSVSGSVLENLWFKRGFLRELKNRIVHVHYQRRKRDPAVAYLKTIKDY